MDVRSSEEVSEMHLWGLLTRLRSVVGDSLTLFALFTGLPLLVALRKPVKHSQTHTHFAGKICHRFEI